MTARFPAIVAVICLSAAVSAGLGLLQGCSRMNSDTTRTAKAAEEEGRSIAAPMGSPQPSASSAKVGKRQTDSRPLASLPSTAGGVEFKEEAIATRSKLLREHPEWSSLREEEAAGTQKGTVPGDKIAYLTFDDGPSSHTDQILDILARQHVHATFFVIGQESDRAKAMYKRIAQEGHQLGNHTYSHDYRKIYASPQAFLADAARLTKLLRETAGVEPDIIRFPGGSNTRLGRHRGQAWQMPRMIREVRAAGFQYFDWNVSSTDAAQAVQPKKDILAAVRSAAMGKSRAVVLMHDVTTKRTTLEALPEVIRELKRQGFRFDTLRRDSYAPQFLKP